MKWIKQRNERRISARTKLAGVSYCIHFALHICMCICGSVVFSISPNRSDSARLRKLYFVLRSCRIVLI